MSTKTQATNQLLKKVRAMHGREFVELLDELIKLRATEAISPPMFPSSLVDEPAELLKRDMADYLNDIDQTGGVQVK